MMDVATIEREALSLTLAERALLADRLLRTLDLENSQRMERWGREADRRLEAFERGEMRATDGPEAVAAIRSRLG
jgi:chaperone required for assembly of F1-ATPase